jgi:hypothetical protein
MAPFFTDSLLSIGLSSYERNIIDRFYMSSVHPGKSLSPLGRRRDQNIPEAFGCADGTPKTGPIIFDSPQVP